MKKLLTVLMAVSFFVLPACSNKSLETPASISQPLPTVPSIYAGKTISSNVDISAGANLFKTDCAACHGENGHGDGPASQALDPRPANLVDLSQISADDFLFWKISTGIEGTAMPAWKGILTDKQIWQVIAFIHALK
jgi:mono/diheme cytochrome c family protein